MFRELAVRKQKCSKSTPISESKNVLRGHDDFQRAKMVFTLQGNVSGGGR